MPDELVKMFKGDEVIAVHPSCVADHQSLGWTVVTAEPVAVETPSDEPPAKKKK